MFFHNLLLSLDAVHGGVAGHHVSVVAVIQELGRAHFRRTVHRRLVHARLLQRPSSCELTAVERSQRCSGTNTIKHFVPKLNQCDQTARLCFQFLALYSNEYLHKFFTKLGSQILSKLSKYC